VTGLTSRQKAVAEVLIEWWEDLWQLAVGPQVVVVKVPSGWGRSRVLEHLAETVHREDAPDTRLVLIHGRNVTDTPGTQAVILRGLLLKEARAPRRAADQFGLDRMATKAPLAVSVAALFASGMPAEVGFLLADVAAGAAGSVWDKSPRGQEGALASAARAVAAAAIGRPVLVLVDDADCLDTDLVVVMLQNLAYRSDGQVLAVVVLDPEGALARALSKDSPYALTGRVNAAEADPDMSAASRASLVRERCPLLPDRAVRRIAERTQTFKDVLLVTSNQKLAEIGQDHDRDAAAAAVDAVINAAEAGRARPSSEAVIVAWAGGLLHTRQADAVLAQLGDKRVARDPDLTRFESLVRPSDPASPRLAMQVSALSSHIRQVMAQAVLGEAARICADPQTELLDRIVAGQSVHRIRLDLDAAERGRLLSVQCDLVAGLEAVGDRVPARDVAAAALAECPPGQHQRERSILSAAVLRLSDPDGSASQDPLVQELIDEAVAGGAVIGLEGRIRAAISLLQMPGPPETALRLTDQIAADLNRQSGLGAGEARWRLSLALQAGRAGYGPVIAPLLGPLLKSEDTDLQDAANMVMRAAGDPQADVRLQVAVLEAHLEASELNEDDQLRLHHALASAYAKLGEYRNALARAQDELPLRCRLQGDQHPDTLQTRADLANWTGYAGSPAAARDQHAELLPALERILGPDHELTMTARHDRAMWTGLSGDPASARDQLAALVPAQVLLGAPGDPALLTIRQNLAYWTAETGDPAAARDQCAALLPDIEDWLGAEHDITLRSRHNLADWTGMAGDPAAARGQHAELLPIRERVLGVGHPSTLATRASLAYWAGQAGDPAAARDQLAELLPIREHVNGPDHPSTLTTRHNLAMSTGTAGNPAAARDQLAALVPIRERVLGPEHPDTLASRQSLANWTGFAGDPAAARDQMMMLLHIRLRILGRRHPLTLETGEQATYWTAKAKRSRS
jgi:hypothetical protein